MNKHPTTAAWFAGALLVVAGAAALAVPVSAAGGAGELQAGDGPADGFYTPRGPAELRPLVCERPARGMRGVGGSGSLVWVAAAPGRLSA